MNIYEKLLEIQSKLNAPKSQRNNFGGYNYRSCEDIFEALKPLLEETKTTLKVSDELVVLGSNNPTTVKSETLNKDGEVTSIIESISGTQRFYIKATATLIDLETKDKIENTAYAREEESKKGMDGSQVTGATSSYARKYALNGLFLIDDVKDTDTEEYQKGTKKTTKVETKKITDEQLTTLTNLDRPLKDHLVETYKKDITQLTEVEAITAINSLKKRGLIK